MGDRLSVLEATYLAWIDVRDLELTDAEAHFVAHGIGISPGSQFDGDGHIRLNFGCPRQTLLEGLERLSSGIDAALK
jgi:cystathionine beta-lyase